MSSAYLKGIDRNQHFLLPESVDDYIGPEHSLRVIDAFIDRIVTDPKGEALFTLREMGDEVGRSLTPNLGSREDKTLTSFATGSAPE